MSSDSRRLICGAMSGTSADGVDAALVDVRGHGTAMTATPVSHAYVAFADDLRSQILDVRDRGEIKLAHLAEIGRRVTLAHVDACRAAFAKAKVTNRDVDAIAAHGQTLWHGPPSTIQYFDPSLLAAGTDCAVVSDFRRADLAAGGQGAPLVPFADWILFRHPTKNRVILNLGGIANITYLQADGAIDDVIAFDTGPGNCLSDWAVRAYFPESPGYDEGGAIAARGWLNADVARAFLRDPFFDRPPPRSTDGPEMIAAFKRALPPPDRIDDEGGRESIVTTAAFCATLSIWRALDRLGPWPDEVIVAGGGVRNAALMDALAQDARGVPIRPTDEFGIAADAREAIAFALLGAATLDGEPSNLPSATGATRRVILGSITPRP